MKIERTSEPLVFWKSIIFALFVSITVFGAWVILLMCFMLANVSSSHISAFVDVLLVTNIIIFFACLIGHFLYYNFDADVRRHCVICKEYVYESTMNELKDDDTLESVHVCKCHKWVF